MAGHNPGRQLAHSIIGNDLDPKTPKAPDDLEAPKVGTKHPFHRITIRPQADSSILVEHEKPRTLQGDQDHMMDDYENRTVSSSHATPAAAHAHIGKLMGVGAAPHVAKAPTSTSHIPPGK